MKIFNWIWALLFLCIFSTCKKSNNKKGDDIELKTNVKVIDSGKMVIDSNASDFKNGKFVFRNSGGQGTYSPNDIIVGAEGDGYIRRIVSVNEVGNTISFETTQGNLQDVFEKGAFEFDVDMNNMLYGKRAGFGYSTSNVNLYSNGGNKIDLINARVELDPNWHFNFEYESSGLKAFEFSTVNTNYQATADVKIEASSAFSLFDETDTLTKYTKRIIYWVPAGPIFVPIVTVLNMYIIADYSAGITGTMAADANLSSAASNIELGVKYLDKQWQGIYQINSNHSLNLSNINANIVAKFNYALRPQIAVKINGMISQNLTIGLNGEASKTFNQNNEWHNKLDGWLTAEVNAEASVLGYTLASYNKGWESNHLVYQTPHSIQMVSGDNQSGVTGTPLAQPLKIKVVDSRGQGQKSVKVYFTPVTGNGTCIPTTVYTDVDGFASTIWTVGNLPGTPQYAEASVKMGDGTMINFSPMRFQATDVTGLPTIKNDSILNIKATSANFIAEVSNDGGLPVTERGFLYAVWPGAETKIIVGSGVGPFNFNIQNLTPASLYSLRAYATNSKGTIYSNAKLFETIGVWFQGKYTLTAWPAFNPSSYCGTQHGQQGDVYFYVARTKIATLVRSILPGVPDATVKSSSVPTGSQFRMLNQVQYNPPYNYSLEFDWIMYKGDSIVGNYGNSFWKLPNYDPLECSQNIGGGHKFFYGLDTKAVLIGENPPGALSASEIQKMKDL